MPYRRWRSIQAHQFVFQCPACGACAMVPTHKAPGTTRRGVLDGPGLGE